MSVKTISSNIYTVKNYDKLIKCNCSASNIVITLPNNDMNITIKKVSTANIVTIDATIDGKSSYVLYDNNEYVTLVRDNGVWNVVDNNKNISNLSIDFDLWQPPTQPNTWADTTMNADTFLATFYDDFVGESDGYTVTKTSLGQDESSTYDIYKYEFTPDNYERTIILSSGLHAIEVPAMFGLARLMHYMMNEPNLHAGLKYLKEKVKIICVPLQNPYGFNQSPREYGNSNGVNINRNFDNNGEWASFVESDEFNMKGSAPFSEVETQLLRTLYLSEKDNVDFALDCHTGNGLGAYDLFLSYLSKDSVIRPRLDIAKSELADLIEERLGRSATELIYLDSAGAIRQVYLLEQLGIQGATVEFVPQRFGGDFNGSLDIEYYLLSLSNYLFKCLSSNIKTPAIEDRLYNYSALETEIAKLNARLNILDSSLEIIAVDSFNRTYNTVLGKTETNQTWVDVQGSYGINGNKCVVVSNDGTNARNNIDIEVSDFDISIDINWQVYAGIHFRYADVSNYLLARINSSSLSLFSTVDDSTTSLGSYSFTPSAGTTYTLRIVANADSIIVYLDGTERINVTNSTFQTNTKVGLRTSNDTTSTFDNLIIKGV